MATYDSVHTGEQVDNAVEIVLGNKGKGSVTQPIYLDADGEAQNVTVDANPTQSSAALVQSGGVFTQLSTKYAKVDISTDVNLGTSNTVIPSQGAVKSYVDTHLATKQNVVVAGDGIVKDGNTLSISTDNDFMTVGKLDNKWSHFVSGLDMGYGTETIEKMEAAKHSTFDLSKFTVVGSPNITDDGIASGFSSSNLLEFTLPIANQTIANTFELRMSYISKGVGTLFACTQAGSYGFVLQLAGDKECNAYIIDGNTGNYLHDGRIYIGSALPGNYDADLIFGYDGTKYYAIVNGAETWHLDSASKVMLPASGSIGYHSWFGAIPDSVDLKYLSFTVNGVEVLSGNKTGIDTIKPDDYTVVGTPTITDDGIASGFSYSNYLSCGSLTTSNTSNIEVKGKVSIPQTLTVNNWIYIQGDFTQNGFGAFIHGTNKYFTVFYGGSDYVVTDYEVTTGTLDFNIKINNGNITIITNQNGVSATKTETISNTFTYTDTLKIGTPTFNGYFEGSIDLNTFKIYVDGNLVYQPCLKIPYTQTKDSKKIADYNYKSRVEDEYNQAGFTPYYTLDTESRGNYAVVGNPGPTISSDYVASGFSQYVGIQTPTLFSAGFPMFDIYGSFTTPSIPSVGGCAFTFGASDHIGCFLQENEDNEVYVFNSSDGNDWSDRIGVTTVSTSTKYYYRVGQDATSFYFYLGTSPNNLQFCGSITSKAYFPSLGNNYMNIGTRPYLAVDQHWQGSIDLKDLKVYVDNKLIYQAVTPPNYTMATVKESAIVDSYDNGMNKWTKLANLTCKQQGSCTSGTAVTFTKPYIDTNYALSVPYSAKTKTGFTPSATGDWIANGKVNLNA